MNIYNQLAPICLFSLHAVMLWNKIFSRIHKMKSAALCDLPTHKHLIILFKEILYTFLLKSGWKPLYPFIEKYRNKCNI